MRDSAPERENRKAIKRGRKRKGDNWCFYSMSASRAIIMIEQLVQHTHSKLNGGDRGKRQKPSNKKDGNEPLKT